MCVANESASHEHAAIRKQCRAVKAARCDHFARRCERSRCRVEQFGTRSRSAGDENFSAREKGSRLPEAGSYHISRRGERTAGLRQCNGAAKKKRAFDG